MANRKGSRRSGAGAMPLACLAAVLALVACDPDDDGGEDLRGQGHCGATRCDIRQASCQQAVVAALQCLRGGDAPMPPVDVITEQDYLEQRRADAQQADPEQLEASALFDRGLALLDLASTELPPEDEDAEVVSQIGAVYDPEQERILVIERGEPLDDADAVALLAHEMVHAMQDAEHDLEAVFEATAGTIDSLLAMKAVIEGEATHYQILYYAALDGATADDIDWQRAYGPWKTDSLRESVTDAAPVPMAFLRFPYPFGGDYVSSAFRVGGQDAVNELFERLPETTYEVMFGEPQPSRAEDAESLLLEAGLDLVFDHALLGYDELGAWMQNVFLQRTGIASEDLDADRLQRVSADVFSVYVHLETGDVATGWRLRHLVEEPPTLGELTDWRSALGAEADDPPARGATTRVWSPAGDIALATTEGTLSPAVLTQDPLWFAFELPGEPSSDTQNAGARRYAYTHALPHDCAKHAAGLRARVR